LIGIIFHCAFSNQIWRDLPLTGNSLSVERSSRFSEDRYGHRSTVVTSQIPVDQWHALIGDPTYADAVLDRLVHNAHRIDLNGESLRRTRKPGRKA
jgi:hypothetical protein